MGCVNDKGNRTGAVCDIFDLVPVFQTFYHAPYQFLGSLWCRVDRN